MVKTFQCLGLYTGESHDHRKLSQKSLFGENGKSLLHLLNNLATAFPVFQGKE